MRCMGCFIYTPTPRQVQFNDDALINTVVTKLLGNVNGSVETWNNGKAGLECLAKGGELLVVGHGYCGKGIGAHGKGFKMVTEQELLEQLLSEGLNLKPAAQLKLHAHCCCSATRVRLDNKGAMSVPFAERFGRLLADAGATNITLIGYAGFLGGNSNHAMDYVYHDLDKIDWVSGRGASMTWRIDDGVITKMGSNEWLQTHTVRRSWGRKVSEHYIVSPL